MILRKELKKEIRKITEAKNLRILVPVALFTISILCISYWFILTDPTYDVKEFGMDVYVGTASGFNIDTDAVHFGIVPPGAVSERQILLRAGPFRSLIKIEAHGDIAQWVHVSENNFILEANESRLIFIYATVPEGAKIPDYKKGNLRIRFIKVQTE